MNPHESWGSLLMHSPPSRRWMLKRGGLVTFVFLPVAALIVVATATPGSLDAWILCVSALAVDCLLCLMAALVCWLAGIIVFAERRASGLPSQDPSDLPYRLMDWGTSLVWVWAIPIVILGLWQTAHKPSPPGTQT